MSSAIIEGQFSTQDMAKIAKQHEEIVDYLKKGDWHSIEQIFTKYTDVPNRDDVEIDCLKALLARRVVSESAKVLGTAGSCLQVKRELEDRDESAGISLIYFLTFTGYAKHPRVLHLDRLVHFYLYFALTEVSQHVQEDKESRIPEEYKSIGAKSSHILKVSNRICRLLVRHPSSYDELLAKSNADLSLPPHSPDLPVVLWFILRQLCANIGEINEHRDALITLVLVMGILRLPVSLEVKVPMVQHTCVDPAYLRALFAACNDACGIADTQQRMTRLLKDKMLGLDDTFANFTRSSVCNCCGRFCDVPPALADEGSAKMKAFKACSNCRTALYCSKDCQLKNWKQHKVGCKA